MNNQFTPIRRWKNYQTHLRNIEISLYVAEGHTFQETGDKFNISKCRANQIYRVLMALLSERYFPCVNFDEAVMDKKYYNCEGRLGMLYDYKMKYINFMIDKFQKLKDMS